MAAAIVNPAFTEGFERSKKLYQMYLQVKSERMPVRSQNAYLKKLEDDFAGVVYQPGADIEAQMSGQYQNLENDLLQILNHGNYVRSGFLSPGFSQLSRSGFHNFTSIASIEDADLSPQARLELEPLKQQDAAARFEQRIESSIKAFDEFKRAQRLLTTKDALSDIIPEGNALNLISEYI